MPTQSSPPSITVRGLTAGLALVAGLAVSSCTAPPTGAEPDSEPAAGRSSVAGDDGAHDDTPHWSYDGAGGPDAWADLSSDFAACSTGLAQSPIDLPATMPDLRDVVHLDVGVAEAEEADSGHAAQVDIDDGSTVAYLGHDYDLKQIHAHTPAEHAVGGVVPAAEIHLVHADDDGDLLVLGVLVDEGAHDDAWQPFVDTAAGAEGVVADLDLPAMLPASLAHWSYDGSLTTPPCTEGVRWLVLATPLELSAEQIGALGAAHAHNSRGVQPLGDRTVVGGDATITRTD